jgi:hypothetical protein
MDGVILQRRRVRSAQRAGAGVKASGIAGPGAKPATPAVLFIKISINGWFAAGRHPPE